MCVPVLDKTRISLRSRHLKVVAARGGVEEAQLDFVLEPTTEIYGILNKAKQLLFSAYDQRGGADGEGAESSGRAKREAVWRSCH